MAIQKSVYVDHFGAEVTGAYHKIKEVKIELESQVRTTGEQAEPDDNRLTLSYQYETYANSGVRWSNANSIHGGTEDLPLSHLANVSGYDSLLTECYNHLKTGTLSGAIDV